MKILGNSQHYTTFKGKKYLPDALITKWHVSSDAIRRILHKEFTKIYIKNGKKHGLKAAFARELGCSREHMRYIIKEGGENNDIR